MPALPPERGRLQLHLGVGRAGIGSGETKLLLIQLLLNKLSLNQLSLILLFYYNIKSWTSSSLKIQISAEKTNVIKPIVIKPTVRKQLSFVKLKLYKKYFQKNIILLQYTEAQFTRNSRSVWIRISNFLLHIKCCSVVKDNLSKLLQF